MIIIDYDYVTVTRFDYVEKSNSVSNSDNDFTGIEEIPDIIKEN